jgi:hypothetical protein
MTHGADGTLPSTTAPAPKSKGIAATVKLIDGSATLLGPTHQAPRPVEQGMEIHEGDTLTTGRDTEVHLLLDDGAYMAVRPETQVRLTVYHMNGQAEDRAWIDLFKGALRVVSGWVAKANPQAFRLQTPTATIGIRGTDFEVQHFEPDVAPTPEEAGTHHLLHDGLTVLSTELGELEIQPSLAAFVLSRQDRPLLHPVLPLFFRRRRGRFEGLIQQHIAHLQDALLAKLQEKELLNPNETLQQRLERFREDNPIAAHLSDREVIQRMMLRRAAAQRTSGGFGRPGGGLGSGRNGGGGRR